MLTCFLSRRAAAPASRRGLLLAAAAGIAGSAMGCDEEQGGVSVDPEGARLSARVKPPSASIEPGEHPLGLDSGRDGRIYLPASYTPDREHPLLVLLHGAYTNGAGWLRSYAPRADATGVVLLATDSRYITWDVLLANLGPGHDPVGGFGPDIEFLDGALAWTFDRCAIDPTRLWLAGFSDGASYALTLGLANGDLFGRTIAHSPGTIVPVNHYGAPRFFVSHGTRDDVLPIDQCSRRLVPELQREGYDVTYSEFGGGHEISPEIADESFAWLSAG
jgi:phospholipase/carboxylesterase